MNVQAEQDQRLVTLAYISAIHGVKGWVKIYSYTDPKESVLDYQPWILEGNGGTLSVLASKIQLKGVIARLDGIDSAEKASALIGTVICVQRSQLEDLPENEFYWADLEGLKVINLDGISLGQVKTLMATGANDVLVVEGEKERLIPFVMDQYIKTVDMPNAVITVDWDPEF